MENDQLATLCDKQAITQLSQRKPADRLYTMLDAIEGSDARTWDSKAKKS